MRTRKLECGTRNVVGRALMVLRVDRQMKTQYVVKLLNKQSVNIDCSSLSKIEGGHRQVTDKELLAFSKIYGVTVQEIFEMAKWAK